MNFKCTLFKALILLKLKTEHQIISEVRVFKRSSLKNIFIIMKYYLIILNLTLFFEFGGFNIKYLISSYELKFSFRISFKIFGLLT